MSLATICENVASDLGIDDIVPPVFGSRVPAARRLVAQARRALWALVRRAAWADLVVEHEFTANGTSLYPTPPDLLKVINETVWERTRYWAMRGALSPQQWQRYRSSIYGRATIWRRWRIRVPSGSPLGTPAEFMVDPLVASTDFASQFVYEYQSAWAVRQPDGTIAADWSDDDDTALVDEMLLELGTRWRMMRRLGLAYDEERDEYEREVDKAVARDGGSATLNLVPFYREDFIGQYSLGAFPPSPPAPPAPGPHEPLPPDIARRIAPFEDPDWGAGPPPLRPQPVVIVRGPSEAEVAAAIIASALPRMTATPPPPPEGPPLTPPPPPRGGLWRPTVGAPLGAEGGAKQLPPGT